MYGCRSLYCCVSSQSRNSDRLSSFSRSPAAANALTERVVTQVDRFVSIGQLPSSRTDLTKKETALPTTECSARPMLARASVTNAVNGAASRKPPLDGWIASRTRRLFEIAILRASRAIGFHGGRW